MPSFLLPLSRYADFNGRSSRAEYWQFWAFQFVVGIVLGIVGGRSPLALISVVFSLAMLIPNLAVTIRRFHDTNRTGWWTLFPSGVAAVMTVIAITMLGSEIFTSKANGASSSFAEFGKVIGPMLALVIIPTLLASIVTFVFLVLPGTQGPNRFGSDPYGGGTDIARVFDAPVAETSPVDEAPYKPVFDFGPTGTTQRREEPAAPQAMHEAPPPPRPAPPPAFGATARPAFGKRGL